MGVLKYKESSADLAVVAAIISSFRDRPISKESIFIGEVSLTGEIKDVFSIDMRLKEAQAQGIKKAVIAQKINLKLDLKIFPVDEVSKMIELFLNSSIIFLVLCSFFSSRHQSIFTYYCSCMYAFPYFSTCIKSFN